MKQSMSDRLRKNYEDRYRIYLPRRTYTLLRLDGKAFHTYTKGLQRPVDEKLMADMDAAAGIVLSQIAGAQFAYVQSDEVSILVTDFQDITTEAWFDNNLQKLVSVSSSIMTAEFNRRRFLTSLGQPDLHKGSVYDPLLREEISEDFLYYDPGHLEAITGKPLACFDSRVWQIPDRQEVANYFYSRQRDCYKNCWTMYAQSYFSDKELHGKTTEERIQMLFEKGVLDVKAEHKFGRVIRRDGVFTFDGLNREDFLGLIPSNANNEISS